MHLTDDDIWEFKGIYEREFKEELTFEEARIEAEKLIRLYELLARPLPCELDGTHDSCPCRKGRPPEQS